jgi:predicted nucleic acid-binding protein
MILLDTCVISEAIKPQPDPRVIAWLEAVDEDALFLSAIAIGELKRGVELLREGAKKDALRTWFEELQVRFAGRILDLDAGTMLVWGDLSAKLKQAGQTLPLMDSLVAACALRNNALLATRNIGDFTVSGALVVNPWD